MKSDEHAHLRWSNVSFLSVRLLTWKPIECLKSVTFLGSSGCFPVDSFFALLFYICNVTTIRANKLTEINQKYNGLHFTVTSNKI
jgi:hypothetical protein